MNQKASRTAEGPSQNLVLTARGVVRPAHCDHMEHMNVMWYTARFDEATWHLFHMIGVTPSYMRTQKKGMAGVQQDTTYKQELFAGDLITVWSRILEMRERVIRFYHEMRNEETQAVAATTTLTAVHLDRVTHKACPFPAEILERGHRGMTGVKKP